MNDGARVMHSAGRVELNILSALLVLLFCGVFFAHPLNAVSAPTGAGLIFNAASTTLFSNYDLNVSCSLCFQGSQTMVVNGRGMFLRMARVASPLLVVAPNCNVTLTNIVLKDLSPAHILLGKGASLTFGDNVYIQLAENATPLTYSWSFNGQGCVLDGQGKVFHLCAADSLLLNNAMQLSLKDITLVGVGTAGAKSTIRCAGPLAQLTLDDAIVHLSPFFNIQQGNVLVKNNVALKGRGSVLAWTSTGTLTIASNSCLKFDYGTTFSYDSAAASRTQLVMNDLSAFLEFDNATLHTTHTGLIISGGTVFLDNLVTLSSEGSNQAEAIVFDSNFPVYVPLGATLDVYGPVIHQ